MKLKNLMLALLAVVATVATINTSSAQDLNGWTAGGKLNIYSRWDGTVGIGVYARHSIGENLRIEPALVFLCERGMSIDLSADVQYPFELANGFEAYPLAGLSLNDPGKFGLGINLGGGLGYRVSDRVSTDLGLKWIIQTQKYTPNPIVISLGCGYRF